MVRKSTLLAGVAGSIVATAGAWALSQRHSTDSVPSTVVAHVDDVELRRYPALVSVETVASTEREAFGRLFRYISGANETEDDIEMTAPVERSSRGTSIPMTAPVAVARAPRAPLTSPFATDTRSDDDDIRMAFYLPSTYSMDSAPTPASGDVDLVTVPARTLAVRQFTWRPTDDRVAAETEQLLSTLDAAGVPLDGDPFFMGYDAPWTLPFLRRNEVAVPVVAQTE